MATMFEGLDIDKYRHMRASEWREVPTETLYILAKHKGRKGNGSAVAHKAQELLIRRNGLCVRTYNRGNHRRGWAETIEYEDDWDEEDE